MTPSGLFAWALSIFGVLCLGVIFVCFIAVVAWVVEKDDR